MVTFKTLTFKRFTEILFLNLFLFPIYPDNVKPTFVVLFFITAIYTLIKKRSCVFNSAIKFKNLLVINTSVFLMLVVSLLYSNNTSFGLKYIFRSLPLLLFPIAFFVLRESKTIFSVKLFLKANSLHY